MPPSCSAVCSAAACGAGAGAPPGDDAEPPGKEDVLEAGLLPAALLEVLPGAAAVEVAESGASRLLPTGAAAHSHKPAVVKMLVVRSLWQRMATGRNQGHKCQKRLVA